MLDRLRLLALVVLAAAMPCAGEAVRGVSLAHLHSREAGYGSDACREQLRRIAELGANWVAISDFAYMPRVDAPQLAFRRDRSMTRDDLVRVIGDARRAGLKVLVKPHLWSRQFGREGKWAGDIAMTSDADWDAWFAAYGDYVLYNAEIAAEAGAEALCVGVELEGTSAAQERRWRDLIARVRAVYGGTLCYASAWGEWQRVPFWDALDCIGINAYFPLADGEDPSDARLRAAWEAVLDQIEVVAERTGRPVCFTEIGYTVSARAAVEPWSGQVAGADEALQARLYRIAVERAGSRPWLKGVFVWKWFTAGQWDRYEGHDPFAIQHRPQVIEALRRAWGGSSAPAGG